MGGRVVRSGIAPSARLPARAPLAALLAVALAACQVAITPGPAPTQEVTPMTTPAPFTLTSAAFAAGGAIPRRQTCDGADVSPPLAWNFAPAATQAYALVVDDPDAPGGLWIHWVVYDLPASATSLPEAVPPSGSGAPKQGLNDFRRVGWGGPCPPSGTHRYVFTLYALSAPLGLSGTPSAAQVRAAAKEKTLAVTTLIGTYRR